MENVRFSHIDARVKFSFTLRNSDIQTSSVALRTDDAAAIVIGEEISVLRCIVFAAVALLTTGCASTQLNYNAVNLGQNYTDLLTRQVSYNLHLFSGNQFSIPSQVKIGAGTSQTTHSITPNFSLPFTNQLVSTVGSAASGASASRALTSSSKSMSLGLNDQWVQSWSLDPVSDPDQLRRLQTLCRFATRYIDIPTFECSYPIIEAAPRKKSDALDEPEVDYVRLSCRKINGVVVYDWIPVKPDRTFIKQPGCILCDYGDIVKIGPYKGARILKINDDLTQQWFLGPNDVPPPTNPPVKLPSNGDVEVYVAGDYGLAEFYNFVLFIQEASVQGVGSPASNGQSFGRKTEPTIRVIGPVVGSGTIVP